MDSLIRVAYYQEIMPGDESDPDFTIGPELITQRSDGIPPGGYLAGPLQGTFALDVSSFDKWRRMLSLAALDYEAEKVWSNPDVFAGEPFYELIHCERRNVFGPGTSLKLAEDFRKYEEPVEQKICSEANFEDFQFFMDFYQLFKKAFIVSCNSGCTIFS